LERMNDKDVESLFQQWLEESIDPEGKEQEKFAAYDAKGRKNMLTKLMVNDEHQPRKQVTTACASENADSKAQIRELVQKIATHWAPDNDAAVALLSADDSSSLASNAQITKETARVLSAAVLVLSYSKKLAAAYGRSKKAVKLFGGLLSLGDVDDSHKAALAFDLYADKIAVCVTTTFEYLYSVKYRNIVQWANEDAKGEQKETPEYPKRAIAQMKLKMCCAVGKKAPDNEAKWPFTVMPLEVTPVEEVEEERGGPTSLTNLLDKTLDE